MKLKHREKSWNGWPSNCWSATAAALSVRVFFQSASIVPCCIHLVLPLKQLTKVTSADEGTFFKQTYNTPGMSNTASFSLATNHALFSEGSLSNNPLLREFDSVPAIDVRDDRQFTRWRRGEGGPVSSG